MLIIFHGKTNNKMMKEKTIKEWLETLPDGYRERALVNLDPDNASVTVFELPHALRGAFTWSNTPEKGAFWKLVCRWALGKGELPLLPTETGYFRISERTPENGEAVIVRGNQFAAIGWWDDQAGVWLDKSLDSWDAKPLKDDVTHWMYIPELPEVEE